MAGRAQLKFVMTECSKTQICLTRHIYCITEVLEQPGGGTPVLYTMVIRDQRHTNISKQKTLLADVDIVPTRGMA